jgi:hypothetical protein
VFNNNISRILSIKSVNINLYKFMTKGNKNKERAMRGSCINSETIKKQQASQNVIFLLCITVGYKHLKGGNMNKRLQYSSLHPPKDFCRDSWIKKEFTWGRGGTWQFVTTF